MLDIALIQDDNGLFDIALNGFGDLESVDDFSSAIDVSLLSDARADESQISNPERRRGWIGDVASPVAGRKLGSLNWTLEQARVTQSTINKARNFSADALQWFVDDGLASNVDVTASRGASTSSIGLTIVFTAPNGDISSRFIKLWQNMVDNA